MMILLTAKERNKVYKEWLAKSIPGEPLDFDALDEAQGKAQLKKVAECWGKTPILHVASESGEAYDLASVDKFWQALPKEVG